MTSHENISQYLQGFKQTEKRKLLYMIQELDRNKNGSGGKNDGKNDMPLRANNIDPIAPGSIMYQLFEGSETFYKIPTWDCEIHLDYDINLQHWNNVMRTSIANSNVEWRRWSKNDFNTYVPDGPPCDIRLAFDRKHCDQSIEFNVIYAHKTVLQERGGVWWENYLNELPRSAPNGNGAIGLELPIQLVIYFLQFLYTGVMGEQDYVTNQPFDGTKTYTLKSSGPLFMLAVATGNTDMARYLCNNAVRSEEAVKNFKHVISQARFWIQNLDPENISGVEMTEQDFDTIVQESSLFEI